MCVISACDLKGKKIAFEDKELALSWYKKALKLTDEHSQLLYLVGSVLLQLGQPEKALEYFEKSISVENVYPDSYYSLSKIEKTQFYSTPIL